MRDVIVPVGFFAVLATWALLGVVALASALIG